ncbi:MAG: hypothetical protein DSY92_02810, partial [Planctomycetota bacterium]
NSPFKIEKHCEKIDRYSKLQGRELYEKGKKYPLIFLIHGGPQGHWTDDFHYRWNLQMFASPGYVVVAVNPRSIRGDPVA